MRFNRVLPLFGAVAVYGLMQIFYFFPKSLFVVIILVLALYMFIVRQFVVASRRKENPFNYLALPGVFFVGLTLFSTILPSSFFVQALFLLNSLFSFVYLRTIYHYLVSTDKYQKQSMENISSYGNFIAFYFIASTVYGLQVFLNLKISYLMLGLLLFVILIVYQVFWVNRVDSRARFFYMLLLAFLLVELAWALSFMTLNYYILGLILAICYYILIGLTRFYLLKCLTKRVIKAYLYLGIGSLVLVLLTANWVSYG